MPNLPNLPDLPGSPAKYHQAGIVSPIRWGLGDEAFGKRIVEIGKLHGRKLNLSRSDPKHKIHNPFAQNLLGILCTRVSTSFYPITNVLSRGYAISQGLFHRIPTRNSKSEKHEYSDKYDYLAFLAHCLVISSLSREKYLFMKKIRNPRISRIRQEITRIR